MVRNYNRKTDRDNIPPHIIESAVNAVQAGGKVATIAREFPG